jgi:hypothetical protein
MPVNLGPTRTCPACTSRKRRVDRSRQACTRGCRGGDERATTCRGPVPGDPSSTTHGRRTPERGERTRTKNDDERTTTNERQCERRERKGDACVKSTRNASPDWRLTARFPRPISPAVLRSGRLGCLLAVTPGPPGKRLLKDQYARDRARVSPPKHARGPHLFSG